MKVFITGIESFIAKELVKHCERLGFDIVGTDLEYNDCIHYHQVDIRSSEIENIIPNGVDVVIHLAALSRDIDCKDNAYNCFDSNLMGTINLMNVARKKRAKQFIFASTEWVYTDFDENQEKDEDSYIDIVKHRSEYALSKLLCENVLRQKYQYDFLDTTILRFGIIYGPRRTNWSAVEAIFNEINLKPEIHVGSLKTGRHFIHVSDIASGIINAIGLHGFNILNIQGNRLITLNEIIEAGKVILKKSPEIIEKTPESASVRRVSGKKAKQLINWQPKVDLDTGLRSLLSILN